MRLELHDGYVVRDWRASDAEALPRHANDRRIWLGLRDAFPHPYTPEDAHRFLAMVAAQDPRTYFCIASPHDEAIGAIGFLRHQDVERFSAEIGYWLSRRHWGHGIATAALVAVTRHAIETHGLNRLYALPFAGNPASVRVLEKAGYVLEGRLHRSAFKDGRFVDQFLYAFVRAD